MTTLTQRYHLIRGKYFISEYLDNLTGAENNSGSYCMYNDYEGLIEELYNLIFESKSISIEASAVFIFRLYEFIPETTLTRIVLTHY